MGKNIKIVLLLLIVVTFILTSPVVIASDISEANYYGLITVTNNSTASTMVSVNISGMNTAESIDANFLNAAANNWAIQTGAGADTAFMPGYSANATILWLDSIGANGIDTYTFYMANATGGKLRYFPDTAGMLTVDSPGLELSDNGSIEVSGWINTDNGTSKDWLLKSEALRLYVSPTVSGNITAAVSANTTTSPTGHTDPAADWNNEANAYDNDTGTIAEEATPPAGGAWGDYLQLSVPAGDLESIRFWHSSGGMNLVEIDLYFNGGWNEFYEDTWANGFGAWYTVAAGENVTGEVSEARIRFRHDGGGGAAPKLNEFDFSFYQARVSATGITTGEHTANVTAAPLVWGVNNVLDFDGTANSNINCGVIYDSEEELWVSIWVRPDVAVDAGYPSEYVWGKRTNSSNTIEVRIAGSNIIFYQRNTGTTWHTLYSAAISWNAGTWHHIVASTDNITGARLRVDGVLTTDAATPAPTISTGNFVIGDYSVGGGSGLVGSIANVIVGTDELTPTEELALYAGTAPGDATDLWYIDEGVGATITSYGTAANAGTAGASNSWDSSTRPCKLAILIDSTGYGGYAQPVTIPDNSSNWTSFPNIVTPYMEYQRINVAGVLQQDIQWEYDTTFTDLSGNSHDATPTFRTTSSDADVSAALTYFAPVSQPQAPPFAIGVGNPFISDNITATDNYTSGNVTLSYPGKDIIDAISSVSATPIQLPTTIIATFLILVVSIVTSAVLRRYGSGSIFIKILVLVAGFGLAIALHIYDWWMLGFLLIAALAILMISNNRRSVV